MDAPDSENAPLTLVILAAGAGRRYGGLKQLAPIGPGGEALLEYSVYDAVGAGFSRVVLVIPPGREALFRERFAGMARSLSVTHVEQSTATLDAGLQSSERREKPWGTGHAVLLAESAVEGAFAVANADDFYGPTSFADLAHFLRTPGRPGLALVGFELGETLSPAGPVSRALCRLEGKALREIAEVTEIRLHDERIVGVVPGAGSEAVVLRRDEVVSMNLWGFRAGLDLELSRRFRSFLAEEQDLATAEFLLPDLIRAFVRERVAEVEVLSGGGPWCGVTFAADEARARAILGRMVEKGRYPRNLWG